MIGWLLLSVAFAVGPVEEFERANIHYENGNFQSATAKYSQLVQDGMGTGPVLYNLGNSQLRDGQLGHAIAAYRRAGVEWPRNRDLAENLTFARGASKAMAAPVELHPLARWAMIPRLSLSPNEERWLFAAINGMFWLAFLLLLRRPESMGRRYLVGTLFAPLLMLGGSVAFRDVMPIRVGVVVSESTKAFAEPVERGPVRFVAHEGTELWWSERDDRWVRVALSDGRNGWVLVDDLALLRL